MTNQGGRGDEFPMELPGTSMVDEPVVVRLHGRDGSKFERGSCLFGASFMNDERDNTYYSLGYYVMDNTALDLSFCSAISFADLQEALPAAPPTLSHAMSCTIEESTEYETYTGIEKMAFVWSMKTVPGCRFGMRYSHRDVTKPMCIGVMVGRCYKQGDIIQYEYLNSKMNHRWYFRAENTLRTVIETDSGVRGTLFTPKKPGVFPAVIDMFGTAGGILEFRAALLASHGFICLALPYFDYKDLPESFWGIDLEYFEVRMK